MVKLNLSLTQQFREKFFVPNKDALRWFPGHMGKGIRMMQQKLKTVDCIIEVHDARIPISGRNPQFRSTLLGVKPHILILNKCDLADMKHSSVIKGKLCRDEGITNVIYTDCKRSTSPIMNDLIPILQDIFRTSERYNRSELQEYAIMVIGVPNVGKSSLINALRKQCLNKHQACPVGNKPGVTRAVQSRIKISSTPLVFILDTPGILTPNVPNLEAGMKLAACGVFKDHMVGEINIADYLLYKFNKDRNSCYFDFFYIEEPCDDIGLLLAKKAIKEKIMTKIKDTQSNLVHVPDVVTVAKRFIEAYRAGLFGQTLLDNDILQLN